MRYSCAAALILAATTGAVAADPQPLTVVEMDRITAGTIGSQSVVQTSEIAENGNRRTRTRIVEEHWENGKLTRKEVEVVNGRVVKGNPAVYRRYLRDNAEARRILRDIFSDGGANWLDELGMDLDFGSFLHNSNLKD